MWCQRLTMRLTDTEPLMSGIQPRCNRGARCSWLVELHRFFFSGFGIKLAVRITSSQMLNVSSFFNFGRT
jgi:hypothetical protein